MEALGVLAFVAALLILCVAAILAVVAGVMYLGERLVGR